MIHIRRHENTVAFRTRAEPGLLRAEAEHNLMLGLSATLSAGSQRTEGPAYLATVEDGGDVVGAALRTPPFKLVLTRLPASAVCDVVDYLFEPEVPAPGGPA